MPERRAHEGRQAHVDLEGLAQGLEALRTLVALRLEEAGLGSDPVHAPPPTPRDWLSRPLPPSGRVDLPPLPRFALDSRFGQLVGEYELDTQEQYALLAALAPELDERFHALFSLLAHGSGRDGLTGESLRNLLAGSVEGRLRAARILRPDAPLRAAGMIRTEPFGPRSLDFRILPDPDMARWVLGHPREEPEFSSAFPARALHTVHSLADLALPQDVEEKLQGLLNRIRNRPKVLGEWGFQHHHDHPAGITALFEGPPGTGKTTAAAALGKEAGLPVFRVDLSAVVSKYIGETEKNLSLLFDRAERRDWILFFDEADALFGKRTEVSDSRDRFANQQVSYLLQRMEAFEGVSLLATNLARNVDDAFMRRIHIRVRFPLPDSLERLHIWTGALPDNLPRDERLELEDLSEPFPMSGGEIRNAVFHAAYRAAAEGSPLSRDHLLHGIREEFDKAGRLLPKSGPLPEDDP